MKNADSEILALFKHTQPLLLRWSDADALGHINNAVYLTYFEEGRIVYLDRILRWDRNQLGMIVAKVTIDFRAPIFYSDKMEIRTRCSRLGSKSLDLEYLLVRIKNGQPEIVTTGTTVMVIFDYKKNTSVEIPTLAREQLLGYESALQNN